MGKAGNDLACPTIAANARQDRFSTRRPNLAGLQGVVSYPHQVVVFPEPDSPSAGPFKSWADWCANAGTSEAATARQTINAWFTHFPESGKKVTSRLRGKDDKNFLQALDELSANQQISRGWEVVYEEDKNSPDFRLYRSSEYIAGIEVRTLLLDQESESAFSRASLIRDEVNSRVRSTDWQVLISDATWSSRPNFSALATWLSRTLASLGVWTGADLTNDNYPRAEYDSPELSMEVTFIPRRPESGGNSSEGLAVAGPPVWQFSKSERRIRDALSSKRAKWYDLRGRPYAIFIGLRDHSDVESAINALYGDDVIRFDPARPGSCWPDRKKNGFFDGRNRRVSCVFALFQCWYPTLPVSFQVIRFDNPWATDVFPDDIIVPRDHFMPTMVASRMHMQWVSRSLSA